MPMPRAGFLAFSQASSGAATAATMPAGAADSALAFAWFDGSALLLAVRREQALFKVAAPCSRVTMDAARHSVRL